MNLLLINYEFPPLGGGAGNATQNIALELSALGHDVKVVTTWYPGLQETETQNGYTIYRIKSYRKKKEGSNPYEMLSFARKAIRFLKKSDFTKNINASIAFFTIPSGIVSEYLKIKFKIPFIISLRGGDVPGFLKRELKYYHFICKPLILFLWRQGAAVAANSTSLQKLAQKSIDPDKVTIQIIPNGVDYTFFKPMQKVFSEKLQIITACRFRPQKQIEMIIDAAQKLKAEGEHNFKLVIAGDGPLRKNLEQLVRTHQLEHHITFTGWIDRAELVSLYQQSDVFILPSLDEGMSNVILEAMACGLPIITTKIPGNLEIIEHGGNGLFIETSQDIADAINTFLRDDALLKKMSKASLLKSSSYSWKFEAQKYLILLTKDCQK